MTTLIRQDQISDRSNVRQCILQCPINRTTGELNFATNSGRILTLDFRSVPLVANISMGYNQNGVVGKVIHNNSLLNIELPNNSINLVYLGYNNESDTVSISSNVGRYFIGVREPEEPIDGDHWYDIVIGRMKLRDSSNWILVNRLILIKEVVVVDNNIIRILYEQPVPPINFNVRTEDSLNYVFLLGNY